MVSQGQVVGRHQRYFGRDKMIFDPWHYLPVLERKPGALRNGAPFLGWDLPEPLQKVKSHLKRFSDWDRQFVSILAAVPSHGLEAVAGMLRNQWPPWAGMGGRVGPEYAPRTRMTAPAWSFPAT
jgi:hypothetical protein